MFFNMFQYFFRFSPNNDITGYFIQPPESLDYLLLLGRLIVPTYA